MSKKLKTILSFLLPPFLTLLILLFLFFHFKITPFGNNTLATMDADVQYVDYFNYYKDVLDGKNTIGYTFSKELGGNMLGAFSYYLASPINLLLKFFPEDKIELFFTLAVTLRLMLASLTFYIFLKSRIEKDPSKKTYLLFLIFSLFYALSSYSLQQSSNLMWLDGVWLLPLMLAGVSKIFDKKSPKLFIISSACALIFNWYSGFLALLFCAFWFFIECLLRNLDSKPTLKSFLKFFWQNGWRLLVSTILAILISCIVLVPSFSALGEGTRGGGIDWAFLHTDLRGKVFSTLADYYPGTTSNSGTLSLFIGAFSLLISFATFLSKEIKTSHKIAYFSIITITLLLFYFNPLYFVFSLLKDVGSYWVRFSFGCFAILLFLAVYIFKTEKIKPTNFIIASLIFFLFGLVFDYIGSPVRLRFYYSLFVILFAASLYFYLTSKTSRLKNFTLALIALTSLGEIVANSYLVLKKYNGPEDFTSYTTSETALIEDLKSKDASTYRVHNLTPRCSFCLNDALSHSYKSLDGYTSSPDDKEIILLHSLGYKMWFLQSNITDDSILATDSLLSVKYLINGSEISENPYALPLVFSTSSTSAEELSKITFNDDNTFDFENKIYKNLSGLDEDFYKKVEFSRELKDDSEIIYHLDFENSDRKLLYGRISVDGVYSTTLLDGEDIKSGWYLTHVGPSVVRLSSNEITLKSNHEDSFSPKNITNEYFYYLDLDTFEKMITKIKSENKVTNFSLDNSSVSFTVSSNSPQLVFTSIHYQSGWEISVNGEKIEPTTFNDSLILLNLNSGENKVELKFHLPGFRLGLILSVFGLLSSLIFLIYQKRTQS